MTSVVHLKNSLSLCPVEYFVNQVIFKCFYGRIQWYTENITMVIVILTICDPATS